MKYKIFYVSAAVFMSIVSIAGCHQNGSESKSELNVNKTQIDFSGTSQTIGELHTISRSSANHPSLTVNCEATFNNVEEEVKKIRSLYYGTKLDELFKATYTNVPDGEILYDGFFDQSRNIKRILVSYKSEDTETYTEFSYLDNEVYFIFSKEISINTTNRDEYRYYLKDRKLVKSEWKHNGTVEPEETESRCTNLNELYGAAVVRNEEFRLKLRDGLVGGLCTDPNFFSAPNFMLALDEYLVIDEYDEKWRTGTPQGNLGYSTCDVDTNALPDIYRNLLGKEVYLEGNTTTTIVDFKIVTKYTPHFGEVQRLEEETNDMREEELQEHYFSNGHKYLVAVCDGGAGVMAKLLVNGEFGEFEADNEFEEYASNLFVNSKEFKAVEKEYAQYLVEGEYTDLEKEWADYASKYVMSGRNERCSFALIHFYSFSECGSPDFDANLCKLYIKEKGSVRVIDVPNSNKAISVSDANNDGLPEFLFEQIDGTRFLILNENDSFDEMSVFTPFHDCGC